MIDRDNMRMVQWSEAEARAEFIAGMIDTEYGANDLSTYLKLYPVATGGIFVAMLIKAACKKVTIVIEESPLDANLFVDDIIDTGKTRDYYKETFGNKQFVALFNVNDEFMSNDKPDLVLMPWDWYGKNDAEYHLRRVEAATHEIDLSEKLKANIFKFFEGLREAFAGRPDIFNKRTQADTKREKRIESEIE